MALSLVGGGVRSAGLGSQGLLLVKWMIYCLTGRGQSRQRKCPVPEHLQEGAERFSHTLHCI